MFKRLESVRDRYHELSEAIAQPEIIQDYPRYQACLRERASLEPIAEAYENWLHLQKHISETRELLSDPLFTEEARTELNLLEEQKKSCEHQLKLLLIPPDPMDDRNIILELRAGVGGEEAALFAADLMRMYLKFADRRGLQASVLSVSDTDLGGLSEALLSISGSRCYARFKYESGVHCVKRVPVTESSGRIHTSTVTVAVMPEAEDVEVEIRPEEIRIDVFHASGHGGQGVNTTDSAVRITYLPTGLSVTCQDERSQLENKIKAMKVLRSRLLDLSRSEQEAVYRAQRKSQIGAGERSEKIRTYFFNHDYVVDHRLGTTVSRVENTLNGDLAPFIDALQMAEKTEKLQQLSSGC